MKTREEDYSEVSYNPLLRAVVIKWRNVSNLDECQLTLKEVMDTLFSFNCKKVISDMSYGNNYSGVVTDWMKVEFIPRLMTHGVKKIAFLGGEKVNFYQEKFVREATSIGGYTFRFFNNRRDMESWLKDYELVPKPIINEQDIARLGYFL